MTDLIKHKLIQEYVNEYKWMNTYGWGRRSEYESKWICDWLKEEMYYTRNVLKSVFPQEKKILHFVGISAQRKGSIYWSASKS